MARLYLLLWFLACLCNPFVWGQNTSPAEETPWNPQELLKLAEDNSSPRMERVWQIKYTKSFRSSSVAISDDGRRVLASDSSESRVFDGDSGRLLARRTQEKGGVRGGKLSASGDWALLHTASVAVLWNVGSGETLPPITTRAQILKTTFAEDGQAALIIDASPAIYRLPLNGTHVEATPLSPPSPITPMTRIAFAPSGERWLVSDRKAPHEFVMRSDGTHTVIKDVPPCDALGMSEIFGYSIDGGGKLHISGRRNEKTVVASVSSGCGYRPGITASEGAQQIRICNGDVFEVRRVKDYPYAFRAPLNAGDVRKLAGIAIASQAWKVAIAGDDALSVWQLPAPPDCAAWRFADALQELAQDEAWDKLELLGKTLQNEREPFLWHCGATRHFVLQAILLRYPHAMAPAAHSEFLGKWLEARPKSQLARLMQAELLLHEGWQARGDGYADTVTEEGWEILKERSEEAKKILLPLMRERNAPPEGYKTLMSVAMAQSWGENEIEPFLGRFLDRHLEYPSPHITVARQRLPRWGGGPRDTVDYADRIARKVGGNEGEWLYAQMAIEMFPMYCTDSFWEVTGFSYDRVQRALRERLEKQSRDDWAATHGAWFAWHHHDRPQQEFFREHMQRNSLVPVAYRTLTAGAFWLAMNDPEFVPPTEVPMQ